MNKPVASAYSIFPVDDPVGSSAVRRSGPTVAAGVLWLAAGLSAGYWVLLAWGRTPVTLVAAAPMGSPVVDTALVARALGVLPVAAPTSVAQATVAVPSRYVLLGVAAVGVAQGAALIGMDGQPARPYRVGATLDGGLVLQSINRSSVRLGPALQGPTTVELPLPTTADARR
ncbi:MAG: type II secretion system protein N [Hydrogenophaga sp.]|uniref:type II secretion system protein N n=1 Tax=Hydrogenophaga sp. TaxID=1904254 RepID=UPI0027521D08|nr:type II secretion system protein N [Hydrogenophaga sp.]MDP2416092.1 type II secretion system protein N [Hydrogenophaga sp.]MDZ4188486.1 type II secretion system protein N [Hydrogenophaga sp.]